MPRVRRGILELKSGRLDGRVDHVARVEGESHWREETDTFISKINNLSDSYIFGHFDHC